MTTRTVAIIGVVLTVIVLALAALAYSFMSGDETCENIVGSEPPQACETP